MLLPQPAFTDSLPTELTWAQTGGVSVGAACTFEFWPYEVAMEGPVTVGAASTIESVGTDIYAMEGGLTAGAATASGMGEVYAMLGGLAAGGATTRIFETPQTYQHDPLLPVKVGGATEIHFEGLVLIPVVAGAASTLAFITPVVHDLDDDGTPAGGSEIGGAAIIQEVLPFFPTAGAVLGSGALILERLPLSGSGGATLAGTVDEAVTYAHPVSGGATLASGAEVAVVVAPTPSGGTAIAGEATIAERSAWHMPAGGVALDGVATAYMVMADYPGTTANPQGAVFPGWAINLETNAPSRYVRLPANSMCTFGGVTYLANEGGIYAYGGDDDDGREIAAGVLLPQTDYGSDLNKRLPIVQAALRTTGRVRLSASTNSGARGYTVITPEDDRMNAMRVTLGLGLEGRYWTLRLDNVDGADLEAESLSFTPIILKRRGR